MRVNWIVLALILIISIGCPPPQVVPLIESDLFLEIERLGKETIIESRIIDDIREYNPTMVESSIILARIDELPIGIDYHQLDELDLALENGFINGLLSMELHVIEKLDNIRIRDKSQYLYTSPENAFYMHAVEIEDFMDIKNSYKANWVLQYQIMEFNKGVKDSDKDDSGQISLPQKEKEKEKLPTVIVYFRLINLDDMKIIASTLARGGDEVDDLPRGTYMNYKQVFDVINQFDFPDQMLSRLKKTAVLDIDILNITGNYSNKPQKGLMAVENGLISGLIRNNGIAYHERPFIIEKVAGFILKYPQIYKNIVINTNPIIYEEWDEFMNNTNCTELLMYRWIPSEGIYLRIIDATKNGEIIYSDFITFSTDVTEVSNIHDKIALEFRSNFDFEIINYKKIMIIDENYHPVKADQFYQNRDKYTVMNLAVEEGLLTALVNNSERYTYTVHEKIKTLYLKQPWMYNDQIFNMNLLYLNNWKELQSFGVDLVLVYSNLVPYEKVGENSKKSITEQTTSTDEEEELDVKKVALTYRVIDVISGEIIFSGQIAG